MSRSVAFPLTIYYDASCPLCAGEMRALQARAHGRKLILVDCSSAGFAPDVAVACGVTRKNMMTFIHARDARGNWLRGVEVFEHAYAAAGLSAMARLWRHPLRRPIWDRAYPWVARHRQELSRLGLPRLLQWIFQRS